MMEDRPLDLVLDAGNSRLKAGLFAGGRLLDQRTLSQGDREGIQLLLAGRRPARIGIGSVAAPDDGLLAHLRKLGPVTVLTGASPAPLRNAYATPLTLGVDRLANAVGALRLFPGRAALAIDLGTCVTYDLVDAEATYRGGAISPGLRMRARAMHAYSARLPEVEPAPNVPIIGMDTTGSLAAGVHHGLRLELQGYIAEIGQQYPELAVVLTGGDALPFARALKSGIFAHPSLTLLGLHALLHHDPAGGPPAAA